MKKSTSFLTGMVSVLLLTKAANADTILYAHSALSDGVRKFSIDVAAGTETLLDHYSNVNLDNGRGVVTVGDIMYYTTADTNSVYGYQLSTHTDLGALFSVAGATGLSTAAWNGSELILGDYSGSNKAFFYTTGGALDHTVTLNACVSFCDGLEYANGQLVSNEGDGVAPYDVYNIGGGAPTQTSFITSSLFSTGIAFDGTYYFISHPLQNSLGVFDINGVHIKDINFGVDGTSLFEDLSVDYNTVLTPEPATFPILGGLLLGLVAWRRKHRQA